MNTDRTTEASAIADLAAQGVEPTLLPLDPGDVARLVVPKGADVHDIDLEHLLDAPRRIKANIVLHDADSLITYVRRHTDGLISSESETDRAINAETSPAVLFADIDRTRVVAVLNGPGPQQAPGWGDHSAILELRLTEPWKLWLGNDRKWLSQAAFAEHIEEGVDDIREPDAADMLEIAQTLQAHNRVEFKSQTLLANGQRQFKYSETVESKAGQQGELTIPSRFKLGLIPFDGQEQGYAVHARFQFRLDGGDLKLRYLLTRVADVLRGAFFDVVGEVETGTGLRAFHGHR